MAATVHPPGLTGHTRPIKHLPTNSANQPHMAASANQPTQQTHEQPKQAVDESAAISNAASMPPPAHPPPHLQHSTHPPPVPPRSLYQPWHPYCTLHWYTTQSPSIRSGLSPQAITATHHSTHLFLSTLSLTLRYPSTVLECALSLYHRFYVRRSMAEWSEVRRVAAVCLFLASKVEDAPRRLIELIRQFEVMQLAADKLHLNDEGKEGNRLPLREAEKSGQQSLERTSSTTSSTQPSSLPSPASLSPVLSHTLVEQRDKLDKLTSHEHELRTQFTSLESEVLLANDFDFTFPLPSHYIHLLVRQLVLSPPRTDTSKGREGWEEEVRQVAWKRAMVRGGEEIVLDAMRTLRPLLPTTACLHFSPQCIAVLCVLIGCAASSTDIERMVELGGSVTVARAAVDEVERQSTDVSVEVKEEGADVRFSPSSFTSTTPSFSPQYAVSPSSPTTASPASLSSIHSSQSQPPAIQPTPLAASAIPSAALPSSSPVGSPYTAAWVQRVLPGVSVEEMLSLFGLLCTRPPFSEHPVKATNDMRRVLLGLDKPIRTRAGDDMLNVLRVRGEYEAVVSEMTEAKRLRDLVAAQKEAEEERRRREEEAASREKREADSVRHRMRDVDEPTRPVSQERQQWGPHSPPRGIRTGGRGGGGWQADKTVRRSAFSAGREGGSWRGAGHRGGWGGRQQPPPQPQPQAIGWQSTVIEPPTAPTASQPHLQPHSLSLSHAHRRAASPARHCSPSPPAKRRRSTERSPDRRTSSGRDRERERDRDRERDGRALRDNGDRQRRHRSRSPSADSQSERHRGSGGRAKRQSSRSPQRDRARGRR